MLARIRKAKEEREGGFTLIELLVVVIIIGILAAIAIPTFLKQREKAWERALRADLHNNALKMEEYFDDNASYPAAGSTPTGLWAFKRSGDNQVTQILASGQYGFCLRVDSERPNFNVSYYFFNSRDGRPVPGETDAGAAIAANNCSTGINYDAPPA